MKRLLCFLPFFLLLLSGCEMLGAGSSSPDEVVLGETEGTMKIEGTVEYVQVEGGVWTIEGETGSEESRTYEPTNLPESFKIDGQKVRVRAKNRTDLGSVYMVGSIIEIRSIAPRG